MAKLTVKQLEALTAMDDGKTLREDNGLVAKVRAGVRGVTVRFAMSSNWMGSSVITASAVGPRKHWPRFGPTVTKPKPRLPKVSTPPLPRRQPGLKPKPPLPRPSPKPSAKRRKTGR